METKPSTPTNKGTKPVDRFEKYGIKNCSQCGTWPATYTPLEDTELCGTCLSEAVLEYKIKQLKGINKF